MTGRATSKAVIDRRSLLQAGACAAMTAPVIGAAASAAAGGASRIAFHRVLFDREDPAAVAFGRAGEAAGLPVEAIGADLTALWRELSLRWRRTPVAIAGLTTETTALYLQHLAQDAGLRLVLRASHTPLSDGRIRHYLSGPRAALQETGLEEAERWPLAALALVRRCPADLASKAALTCTSPPVGAATVPQDRLVSWVVAPVARSGHGHDI